MAEWKVELQGDRFDLEELPEIFHSSDLRVVEEDAKFFLKSHDFNSLASDGDVRRRAELLVERINGSMRVRMRNFKNVRIEAVLYIDDQGVSHRNIEVHPEPITMRSKVAGNVTLVTSQGGQASPPQPLAAKQPEAAWPDISDSDSRVATVLRLFAKELNWSNLYKISEVIYEDQGKKIYEKRWATPEEVRKFRGTANCYGAIGDEARHAREEDPPPLTPMTLGKAEALIRGIARKWLEEKAMTPEQAKK